MLGVVNVVVLGLLLALFMGIGYLFNSSGALIIMFIIWLASIKVVSFIIMHYIGYLIKAGHIAVLTEAVTTGQIPENQVAYGKQQVKDRFATSNVYFLVDKLLSGAVKQIQNGIGKLGDALSFIPGMETIASLAKLFVDLSLGYIDECCLGYTFYKKDESAFKSAADGVAIYAQNWKKLLGNAAKTMVLVLLGIAGITLVLFLVLGLIFRLFDWPGWIAFVLALLLAVAIKKAFIDSYILVRTMVAYMEVAPNTTITLDIYGKLCNLSSKFKELFSKGEEEQLAYAGGADPSAPSM